MEQVEILKRIVSALETHGITHAVAGGLAYSMHVVPRATVDIDIVAVTDKSHSRVQTALKDIFSSMILDDTEMRFRHMTIFRIVGILDENETVIDLLEPVDQDFRDSILLRTVRIQFEGMEIPVVSLEDLYIMKKHSERLQDRADCEMIEKLYGSIMDRAYLGRFL